MSECYVESTKSGLLEVTELLHEHHLGTSPFGWPLFTQLPSSGAA